MYLDYLEASDPAGFSQAQSAHHANIDYYRSQHPNPSYMPHPGDNSNAIQGGSNCPTAEYILPVVVHVMYGSSTLVDSARAERQIDILNQWYRNTAGANQTGVQFCLAKKKPDNTSFGGVTYHPNSANRINSSSNLRPLMAEAGYDPNSYINIYVVDEITKNGVAGLVTGYASYPYPSTSSTFDGIVVREDWLGKSSEEGSKVNSVSQGKTLVHEMGHYLGLYHPWRGGCVGYAGDADCSSVGDKCCDTPPMAIQNSTCLIPPNTCSGDSLPDPVENHMAYGVPSCRTEFTNQQIDIMRSILEIDRSSLWQVDNVNHLDLACCVSAINLSGDNLACKSEQLSINTYEYAGASYQWAIKNQAGVAQTIAANGSNVTATIGTAGMYDVKLTIYFAAGAGSVSRTFVDYLEVADCTPLPSTQANWYFGKYAGLRFTTSGVIRDVKPSRLTSNGQIHTNEGSISMSDSSGALLFYAAADTGKNSILNPTFHLFNAT
jgi:hypothetical protein